MMMMMTMMMMTMMMMTMMTMMTMRSLVLRPRCPRLCLWWLPDSASCPMTGRLSAPLVSFSDFLF